MVTLSDIFTKVNSKQVKNLRSRKIKQTLNQIIVYLNFSALLLCAITQLLRFNLLEIVVVRTWRS